MEPDLLHLITQVDHWPPLAWSTMVRCSFRQKYSISARLPAGMVTPKVQRPEVMHLGGNPVLLSCWSLRKLTGPPPAGRGWTPGHNGEAACLRDETHGVQ